MKSEAEFWNQAFKWKNNETFLQHNLYHADLFPCIDFWLKMYVFINKIKISHLPE